MTDTIADLLTRIRNAQGAKKESLTVPYSTIKEQICQKFTDNGYIKAVKKVKGESFDLLEVTLDLDRPVPLTLIRVSKPGRRVFKKAKELRSVKSGLGIMVLSTPKGILTHHEAKTANVGGEALCLIY